MRSLCTCAFATPRLYEFSIPEKRWFLGGRSWLRSGTSWGGGCTPLSLWFYMHINYTLSFSFKEWNCDVLFFSSSFGFLPAGLVFSVLWRCGIHAASKAGFKWRSLRFNGSHSSEERRPWSCWSHRRCCKCNPGFRLGRSQLATMYRSLGLRELVGFGFCGCVTEMNQQKRIMVQML